MHKAKGRLLIVSHVLVQVYNERYYVQGGFGRHVDAFATRFDEVCLLTCVKTVKVPLDEIISVRKMSKLQQYPTFGILCERYGSCRSFGECYGRS